MFLREISKWTGLFLVTCLILEHSYASAPFELRYEGVIGNMADARLCYDAPFSFSELEGVHWFLGLENAGDYSCLTGTHPEAHSSLWQISPDGSVWGKRQGFEFALVTNSQRGKWEVSRTIEFPRTIQSPAACLMWMGNDGLYVVEENELLKADFEGNWSFISHNFPDLNAYRDRGFVQSQNFVYCWSDEVGVLIDKRTSSLASFEDDGWPEMLAEFEIYGASWRINGDYVQVMNGEDMMQFDLAGKAIFPHQTIFSPEIATTTWELLPSEETVQQLRGWIALLILVNLAIIVIVALRRRRGSGMELKVSSNAELNSPEESGGVDYGFSDSFLEIVNRSSGIITKEEFDQLAHGGEQLSPESQRARRSKLFREVNAESKLVMGYDLLVRERDPHDRRKVRYRIQSLPPRIQRMVQGSLAEASSVPVENGNSQ